MKGLSRSRRKFGRDEYVHYIFIIISFFFDIFQNIHLTYLFLIFVVSMVKPLLLLLLLLFLLLFIWLHWVLAVAHGNFHPLWSMWASCSCGIGDSAP